MHDKHEEKKVHDKHEKKKTSAPQCADATRNTEISAHPRASTHASNPSAGEGLDVPRSPTADALTSLPHSFQNGGPLVGHKAPTNFSWCNKECQNLSCCCCGSARPSSALIIPAPDSRPIVAYAHSVFATSCALNVPASASALLHPASYPSLSSFIGRAIPGGGTEARARQRPSATPLAPPESEKEGGRESSLTNCSMLYYQLFHDGRYRASCVCV